MTFAAELLHVPDLFPARHSGERWGNERLLLDFAGGPYDLRGLSGRQRRGLERRYGELCGAEAAPPDAVEVRVFRAADSDFRRLDSRPGGRDYPLELDPSPDGVRIASRRFVGRLDWRPEPRAALWTPVDGPDDERVGVFENFLRVVAAYRLNQLGGVLLHSAGVVAAGKAFLFVGPSGAGKTTIARLSRDAGMEVLSDDMNVLRLDAGGRPVAQSVPFAGDLGQLAGPAATYPLGGLFRLLQAPEHAREPLAPAPALAALIANAPFVNSDPHRLDRLAANFERLLAAAPLETLAFAPEPGFWRLLLHPEGA